MKKNNFLRNAGRCAKIVRKTAETQISLRLCIDGRGKANVGTGIGFFDHLLSALAKHGLFDLELSARGDLEVDQHHLVEDVGIALGEAFSSALGKKRGIARAGCFAFPMDEALSLVCVDFGGRSSLIFDVSFQRESIGGLQSDLVREFFAGFCQGARCNACVRLLYGGNDHHKCEGIFKGFARALSQACEVKYRAEGAVPSTKGVI